MTRDSRTPHGRRDAATRIILRLCHELAVTRLRYANLLAAAHATLSAARDDEPTALEYLADELAAQHDTTTSTADRTGGTRWAGEPAHSPGPPPAAPR